MPTLKKRLWLPLPVRRVKPARSRTKHRSSKARFASELPERIRATTFFCAAQWRGRRTVCRRAFSRGFVRGVRRATGCGSWWIFAGSFWKDCCGRARRKRSRWRGKSGRRKPQRAFARGLRLRVAQRIGDDDRDAGHAVRQRRHTRRARDVRPAAAELLQRAAVHEAVIGCDSVRGVAFHPPAIPRAIRRACARCSLSTPS